MSIDTIPNSPDTVQAKTIRSAMSLSNVLVTTPTKAAPLKEEVNSPADSDMSDDIETDGADDLDDDADDVPDAQREFICVNDEHGRCKTGQYTMDVSRKVISDHFGRNKACTRDITTWPLVCRKHYQRATYNKAKWQRRKIELILRQFTSIEQQFPGTTYDIVFKKAEEARLNTYSRQVASGTPPNEAETAVAPRAGKHYEAPIDVLRELDQCLGRGKSNDEVKKVVDVILQMLEEEDVTQVPSIEFLPRVPGKVVSPKKSPAKARAPKSPKNPTALKTRSRVSAEGSIKKPTQKT
ncbi:hypothetical protein EJ02DRAFT_452169 [Clathrospora elynae]|uniref:Uncharacterized protein n=1 Tax=Clathrospora elynae TaxID=706981 RepID=A0A6A5SX47_9PLEO|nr:hypothetical protein EJ02DRAFT_452169 [Clathrospora elynae]